MTTHSEPDLFVFALHQTSQERTSVNACSKKDFRRPTRQLKTGKPRAKRLAARCITTSSLRLKELVISLLYSLKVFDVSSGDNHYPRQNYFVTLAEEVLREFLASAKRFIIEPKG